jgi:Guanylate-binding protein, N-terminal domain
VREAITKYFKDRECFTLIRPVTDEAKLSHIEELKWEDLKSDFRREVTNFVKSVKKKLVKPKMIHGKVLNASMFL